MTVSRAAHFSIRSFMPAEVSFSAMVTPRLEMADAGGVRFAQACLGFRCWRLFTINANNALQARSIGGYGATIELSKREACMALDNIPAADGVRVSSTAQGTPTIEFLDEQGHAFAIAEFTPDVFSCLIGECCDLLEIVSKGGLATVECKGQA